MLSVATQESAARALVRVLLPATLVSTLLVGLAWWWWSQQSVTPTVAPDAAETVTAGRAPQPAPAPGATDLERAAAALTERRLLSPAGDNAVEWYLRALDRQADLVSARQALLELIPQAAIVLENSIDSGDLAEAEREFALFKRMGVSELRLAPLRQRLEQAREQREASELTQTERETTATRTAEQSAADTSPAPNRTSSSSPAREPPTPVVASPVPAATSARPAAPTPTPAPPAASDGPTEPATSGAVAEAPGRSVREARQIVDVKPGYPSAARQRRVEGWVELELGVGADGRVFDVQVIASEPARIFDREAMRAAQRWRFEPRMEDGVAVASRVRKKLSFRL